ncbi:MAG TPA: GGDEF domain-containing protein, partial [Burkholderiaceae bacterium]
RGFSAEFAAMDLSAPARNRYRYRLEDFDADWVEADARLRVAAYGNLAPGQYLLRVQGSNRVGDWSPSELLLEVQVQPRWYETWWARVLQGLLLLAALGGIVHLRTRILQRRQHELERRVQERTAELEKLTQALAEASLVDPLTGLHNRRFLGQHIETDVALALRRHEDPLLHHHGAPPLDADMIFFLIDIDHFKQVNDGLGHAAGDAVLVQVGERLRQVFRDTDHLVRWGGEEFLAVARASTRSHAAELAERVRAAIAGTPFVLADGRQTLQTCSIGYACLPLMPGTPRAQGWEAAVELADAALFDAKRAGRNTWVGATRLNNEQDAAALLRLPLRQWLASGYLNIERPPIV